MTASRCAADHLTPARQRMSLSAVLPRSSSPAPARLEPLIYFRGSTEVSLPAEPPPLVLLVEDDRDGRMLFVDWLEDAGFRVEQAHNGLQALERAFDLKPDAIVTDLNIPGIDGYELTRRLKADARTAAIPVLAVTGYAPFTQDPARADRAGCDAVLPKPCDPDDVAAILRTLITEARGRRSA
jgi:two-component system, cell cycle response regulator DivK